MTTTISDSDAPVEDGRLRRGLRTREQILNAAIDLFGSRGFAATSMKDLASAAGVRAPAFYNHFSSKERILAAALIRTLEDFKVHVVDTDDKTRPSVDRLENLVRAHVGYQVTNSAIVRSVDNLLEAVSAGDLLTADDQAEVRVFTQAYRNLMIQLIDDVRSDEGGSSPATFLCMQAVLAVCDQSRGWVRDDHGVTADDVKDGCWALVAGMLRIS
ncbi:MAG: TetR family transcriptional regulator protein [Nocardioidaceae bacterium]|nr:TetR family transcriptional regulator protein [Nocardioidaceae bacterium]